MQTLLLLDEQSVAHSEQVTFHLNPAVKHPANPLLEPGLPHEWDSLQICWPGQVMHDPEAGLFRCWYHGLNGVQADRPRQQTGFPWEPGYAESRDGIHWTKPLWEHSTYRGRPTNRVVTDFDGWSLSTVWLNPDTADSRRRFLGIWKIAETFSDPGMPRALASSPDGRSWTMEDRRFYRSVAEVAQDFWQVLVEADGIKAYGQYHVPRCWDQRVVRQISLHTGPDITHLQDADIAGQGPVVLAPQEGIDEELHFASVHPLHPGYLMLFESDRFSPQPLHGDLRLAVSPNGSDFRRVLPQTPLVATGPRGSWDENLLVTTTFSFLEVGDEIWIYYFGCPSVYRNWPSAYAEEGVRGSLLYPSFLGLATLPRDRFAYAEGRGSLTTRPLDLGAGELWLNVDGEEIGVQAAGVAGSLGAAQSTGYRPVRWQRTVSGVHPVQITLATQCRCYSLRTP